VIQGSPLPPPSDGNHEDAVRPMRCIDVFLQYLRAENVRVVFGGRGEVNRIGGLGSGSHWEG